MLKIFNPLWLAQNYFTLWGGGGGGGGGKSTTTQGIDPAIRPYITYGLSEAKNLYQSDTPQYYAGQTYISPSAQTTSALNLAEQRARAGSPLIPAAQQQALQTIQGRTVNPFLTRALDAAYAPTVSAAQEALRGIQSQASQAGRYGSGAMSQLAERQASALGRSLGQSLSNLAYQSSEAEAARQAQAIANAPAMAAADYQDINQLLQVGQAGEDYAQRALDAEIARFNFEQNKPYAKLSNYLAAAYGAPSGTVTQTQSQSGGKIVCTMMNEEYGFGSFRNKIWLAHSATMQNAKVYEKGYHTMFLPLIAFAKRKGTINRAVKSTLEHIARHRTADIWKQKHGKRDALGAVYRFILEPICYAVGKVKGV